MKNVRIPHILRTLHILHFFEIVKVFWDFIWLGYCLNMFITLRRSSNDLRKNQNPKILKNYLCTLLILHFCELFKLFWDFIWLGYCLNRFITLRGYSNNSQKNQIQKYKKITKGTKNVMNPHILPTLPILHFFELWNFFDTSYGLDIV